MKTLIVSNYDNQWNYSAAEYNGETLTIIPIPKHVVEAMESIPYNSASEQLSLKPFLDKYDHIIFANDGSLKQIK